MNHSIDCLGRIVQEWRRRELFVWSFGPRGLEKGEIKAVHDADERMPLCFGRPSRSVVGGFDELVENLAEVEQVSFFTGFPRIYKNCEYYLQGELCGAKDRNYRVLLISTNWFTARFPSLVGCRFVEEMRYSSIVAHVLDLLCRIGVS